MNKAYANKLCQKCCGNSIDHCSVTSHVKHKSPGYQATKYKKSTDASVGATATSLSEVLPGVVDHLAKAL